jgi:hypothetical protein
MPEHLIGPVRVLLHAGERLASPGKGIEDCVTVRM